jgi:hypothetical protein
MLTEKDSELINIFHHVLLAECNKIGVPCRNLGFRETGNEHQGIWGVSYFWQIELSRYELYVNINELNPEFRYGWTIG